MENTQEQIKKILERELPRRVEAILKITKVIPLHTHNGTDSLTVTQTVSHDATLTGNGTVASPLSVVSSGSKSYAGTVASDGSSVFLPSGWSSSRTGTGDYIITHNLGSTNYAVTATVWNAAQVTIFIANKLSNTIELFVKTTSNAFADHQIDFIIVK